jgi:uncharacterized membrane protein
MENKKQVKNKFRKKIGVLIKRYITTGLVAIIPLWFTYFMVSLFFKWVSNFTFTLVDWFIVNKLWIHILTRVFCFFASIMCVVIIGFITEKVFVKNILNLIGKLIEKLPIFRTVYFATKHFVNFIFGKDSAKNFKEVVFVPYPSSEVYSVAFLTGTQIIKDEKYICAFMPTIPNPTTGFLFLFKEKDIVYTNYTIEQGFQFVISVGVIDMNVDNNKQD